MRKWTIAGLIVAVFTIAVIMALLNASTYIQGNRDRLALRAQAALGRNVGFDSLEISILGGISIAADNFRIGEDPTFASGDFLQVRQVVVGLRFFPLLLGRVEVRQVVFDQPAINVIRTASGFNFSSLGKPSSDPRRENPADPPGVERDVPRGYRDFPLLIPTRILGGKLHYRDEESGTDVTFDPIGLNVKLSPGKLQILDLRALDGNGRGQITYDMSDATLPFHAEATLHDMQIDVPLAILFPEQGRRFSGNLQGTIAIQGLGENSDRLRNTLRGGGRIEIKHGILRNVNVAESVLSGITGVRGLSSVISERTRKKYPDIFSTSDTQFKAVRANFEMGEGRLTTQDLIIAAPNYAITGQGYFQPEQRVDLQATLAADAKLSSDIVAELSAAKYLMGEDGRLRIPFTIQGKPSSVRLRPNTRLIFDLLPGDLLEQEIGRLLGGKKTPGPASKADRQKKLRSTLDRLFGR